MIPLYHTALPLCSFLSSSLTALARSTWHSESFHPLHVSLSLSVSLTHTHRLCSRALCVVLWRENKSSTVFNAVNCTREYYTGHLLYMLEVEREILCGWVALKLIRTLRFGLIFFFFLYITQLVQIVYSPSAANNSGFISLCCWFDHSNRGWRWCWNMTFISVCAITLV